MPDSHMDYESGKKLNLFQNIKDAIHDEVNNPDFSPTHKILEEPESEQKICSWEHSESQSQSEEEEEEEIAHFDNDKVNFMVKLYDQRRAAGIKPALGYQFKPNVDIFEVDSENPCDNIAGNKPEQCMTSRVSNLDEIQNEAEIKSVSDSMLTNEGSSSIDPDSEEIEEFEMLAEEKNGEIINPEKLINAGADNCHNRSLQPDNPKHNQETMDLHSLEKKELYTENLGKQENTTQVGEHGKMLININVPTGNSEESKSKRSRNPSKDNIDGIHKRQPELFESIEVDIDDSALTPVYSDSEEDEKLPPTPTSSPDEKRLSGKLIDPVHVRKEEILLDDPYQMGNLPKVTKKYAEDKASKKEYQMEAIVLHGDIDPILYEDSESSE